MRTVELSKVFIVLFLVFTIVFVGQSQGIISEQLSSIPPLSPNGMMTVENRAFWYYDVNPQPNSVKKISSVGVLEQGEVFWFTYIGADMYFAPTDFVTHHFNITYIHDMGWDIPSPRSERSIDIDVGTMVNPPIAYELMIPQESGGAYINHPVVGVYWSKESGFRYLIEAEATVTSTTTQITTATTIKTTITTILATGTVTTNTKQRYVGVLVSSTSGDNVGMNYYLDIHGDPSDHFPLCFSNGTLGKVYDENLIGEGVTVHGSWVLPRTMYSCFVVEEIYGHLIVEPPLTFEKIFWNFVSNNLFLSGMVVFGILFLLARRYNWEVDL